MTIKTLILGAAAGTLAIAGAQAADLPIAPEPVDYVRVCDAFGSGFFYIPGTETCLRVGGRVRADYRFRDFADSSANNWDSRDDNGTEFRARGYVRLDSRTNTEYGLLRTYTDLWFTSNTGAADGLTIWEAFIQFGGFTFGQTGSFFDYFTGTSWGAQIGQGLDARARVLAYTAAFGNGMSASFSIEDGTSRREAIVGGSYGGHRIPDFVANLRVDQGWGSAQIMGVLHHVNGGTTPSSLTLSPAGVVTITPAVPTYDSELGWAVGAGVTFNVPMFAPGDSVSFQAAYADGAVGYVNTNLTADAVRRSATNIDTATAWGVAAGFTHNWTSTVSTSVTGTYASQDAFGTANDIDQWSVHGTLAWAPVSGLVIGTEIEYLSQDFGVGGTDDDDLTATFRVQRTF